MIRGVLFDMDGVILDTERFGRGIYLQTCADHGYPQMNEVIFEELLGKPQEVGYTIMRRVFGEAFPSEKVFEDYRAEMRRQILAGADVCKPGLKACMDGLKARGMKIALATSTKRAIVDEYIQCFPLMQDVFDAIVCSVEAGRGKPAPDIYLEAARRLGLQPEECIGVEDSVAGLESLTAAGCVRVMIPDLLPCDERFAGLVDYRLDGLEQIPKLVDRMKLGARTFGK